MDLKPLTITKSWQDLNSIWVHLWRFNAKLLPPVTCSLCLDSLWWLSLDLGGSSEWHAWIFLAESCWWNRESTHREYEITFYLLKCVRLDPQDTITHCFFHRKLWRETERKSWAFVLNQSLLQSSDVQVTHDYWSRRRSLVLQWNQDKQPASWNGPVWTRAQTCF